MPYILTFTKAIEITGRSHYINDCCIGGDRVLGELLSVLQERYGKLKPDQEDWGWYLWFSHLGIKLAIEVHTDDPEGGDFQLHLTSRTPRMFRGAEIDDTPELEMLRELVVKQLEAWNVGQLQVERVNEKYE
jgi:hypothetical protein